MVWDEPTQSVKKIEYGTTRGWSYPNLATAVDATPEVKAKAEAFYKAQRLESERIRAITQRVEDAFKAITEIRERRDAVVYKGRKVPKGFIGRVEGEYNNAYGTNLRLQSVSGTEYFVDKKNCLPVVAQAELAEYLEAKEVAEANNCFYDWHYVNIANVVVEAPLSPMEV
jgi:hypothetical protein